MTEELQIKLTADLSNFTKGLDKAMGQVDKMGQRLQSAGKKMTVAFTAPLALIGGKAIANFDRQIKAERRLSSAIESTGGAALAGLNDFKKYASELQVVTNIGDEATLEMLTLATQMGLTAEQAKVAVRQTMGMADAFGMNEKAAIRMAVALQQGDTTMLNRYIPSLKSVESETEKIRIATEFANNAFKTFADSAQTGTGPLAALSGNFNDLLEQFGKIITDAINPFIKRISDMVLGFQSLDDQTKRLIVIIGAFAAAIGPVLLTLGFFATTILPAMIAGFSALFSPITLIVGAIAALAAAVLYIWDNWAAIKERISDTSWWVNMLIDMASFLARYNPFQLLLKPLHELLSLLGIDIENPFDLIADELDKLRVQTKEYKHEFGSFTDALKNGAKAAVNALLPLKDSMSDVDTGAIDAITKSGNNAGKSIDRVTLSLKGLQEIDQEIEEGVPLEGFNNSAQKLQARIESLVNYVSQGLVPAFSQFFTTLIDGGGNAFMAIVNALKRMVIQLAAAATVAFALSVILSSMGIGAIGGAATSFKGLFGKFSGIALAEGGIVSGPTQALIGEYSGARSNPEVVAPLDKLKSMMGGFGQRVVVEGRISGSDILLSNERASNNRTRQRGF